MSRDRISVDTADLTDYVHRNGRLSDDISGATERHLGGHLTISPTMFGDLGHESGLHNTVGDHLTRMHGHVHRLAGSVRDLGQAVDGAKGDYQADEQYHADSYRKILDS